MELKRIDGTVIATSDPSLRELVEANKANMHKANLRGADLHKANLFGANLFGANLRGANLHEANLRDLVVALGVVVHDDV